MDPTRPLSIPSEQKDSTMSPLALRAALALAFAAIPACSSTDPPPGNSTTGATVASCREQFSPDKGYGYQDDLTMVSSPPHDGGAGGAATGTDTALERVVSSCKAGGGAACDPTTFLTHDAAICAAKLGGLSDGIGGLEAGLTFLAKSARVVWNVQNLTAGTQGSGETSGDTVTLDAVDGSVLTRGSWSAIP